MRKFKSVIVPLLIAVMTVLGVAGISAPVYAEDEENTEGGGGGSSLRLSPSGVRYTLHGGDVMEGSENGCKTATVDSCTLTIENTGNQKYSFKLYITPYVVSGSANDLSFAEEKGGIHTQISRWISVKNPDGEWVKEALYEINPGESKKISYKIDVPEDIPGGSQYAVIWAQIQGGASAGGIQTVGQVGAVITGKSDTNSYEQANVNNLQMTTFSLDSHLSASADVQNIGNTDFVAKYRYVAKTFFGKEIHRQEETLAAYPGSDYHVEVKWDDAPMLGIFQVELNVNAADRDETLTRVVVIMPVVVMILLILLLTIVIVWIIIIIRKRKERKAQKLV